MDNMKKNKPHILLTNDDGIRSPGLWAAASELSKIGYVTVAAPREQSSAMGRSLPSTSDGIIRKEQVQVNGQAWSVYAVGGSPAQAVLHGVLEIVPHKPDLVVSGINYGENVGNGITISGTVGAAMEAASMGFPALAISLETETQYHLSHSEDIDFSTAGYFTAYFARLLLEKKFPHEVDLLKVEVPTHATPKLSGKWAGFLPADTMIPCLQNGIRGNNPVPSLINTAKALNRSRKIPTPIFYGKKKWWQSRR